MNDHTKMKVDEELIKKANENTEDEIENECPQVESEHIPELREQELQAAFDCFKEEILETTRASKLKMSRDVTTRRRR